MQANNYTSDAEEKEKNKNVIAYYLHGRNLYFVIYMCFFFRFIFYLISFRSSYTRIGSTSVVQQLL